MGYASLVGSSYTKLSDATYPDSNYIGALQVVTGATFTDPSNMPSGTFNQTFAYAGAWMNLQGRGFEGFYSKTRTDSRNSLADSTYYKRAFLYSGSLEQEKLTNGSKNVLELQNTWAYSTLSSTSYQQRYFNYVSNTTRNEWEVGGAEDDAPIKTTAISSVYDSYGNPTSVTQVITDTDSNSPYYNEQWTTSVTATISASTSPWCLGLPTQTVTTYSSTESTGATITRTMSYTPDYTYCRETQQTVEPGSSTYKVVTNLGYDTFGNVNSQTVTGVGMSARQTTLNWGSTGQFLNTVTNALSQTTTTGFDSNTGLINSVQDPNGISTSWTYDGFARKVLESRPDGTSTSWSYNPCATLGCFNANNKMTVTQKVLNAGGSTQSVKNVYLDGLDRTLVTSATMLSGYNQMETQYDSLGNVHLQGMPCTFGSCTQYWSTNTYDVLNRLTQSQRPISATNSTLQTTTYAYQGRTTSVTDANLHKSTYVAHVTGQMGATRDHNGYAVNFNQDAAGSILSTTDSLGNTLNTATYLYGIGAFRQTAGDIDLGSWSYSVDALGEVTGYTDAKGQSFSQTFDALSRPAVRTEPDLTTTWTWGTSAASYNIGKLQALSGVSPGGTYAESYTFDSAGRSSTRSITIPGDQSYTYTYAYNATTGLLDTLQYPVSTGSYQLKLQYGYANGILQSVADFNSPSTVYWTANTMNARGAITQETLGNNVVTARSYDAVTGWVASIQSGVGSGSSLQNGSYLFDEVGNVTQRQDNNQGLTENFYYDNLNRLDHSTLNGSANLQMAYDPMGNVASRSDVAGGAVWTYDATRKHAVRQAGSSAYTYTYDGNGNAMTRNGYSIGWSAANYPTSISSANKTVSFFYGPQRNHYRQIYVSGLATETTNYAGELLEKVTTGGVDDWRHYIRVGRQVVAILSRQNNINTTRYLLEDHQGSFAKITSSTGASIVAESFAAYGSRRDPGNWSSSCNCSDLSTIKSISRDGYTGQEAIGGATMNLIHMQGRVMDPVTGRFLSADPFIQDAINTQSYNRFSYVMNNPLTLVDPTGFDAANPMRDGPTDPGEDPGNSEEDHSGDVYIAADGLEELHVNGHQPAPPPVDRPTIPQDQDRAPAAGGDGAGAGMDTIVVTGHKPKPTSPKKPSTPRQSPPMQLPVPQLIPVPAPNPSPPVALHIPCFADRANNAQRTNNIKLGAAGGAIVTGLVAANVLGTPEVQVIEGIGSLLGAISSVGDPLLVAFSYAPYGAIVGGVTGNLLTPPSCP